MMCGLYCIKKAKHIQKCVPLSSDRNRQIQRSGNPNLHCDQCILIHFLHQDAVEVLQIIYFLNTFLSLYYVYTRLWKVCLMITLHCSFMIKDENGPGWHEEIDFEGSHYYPILKNFLKKNLRSKHNVYIEPLNQYSKIYWFDGQKINPGQVIKAVRERTWRKWKVVYIKWLLVWIPLNGRPHTVHFNKIPSC